MEFPIRITFVMFQDYQTRQLFTKEGNLVDPIRTTTTCTFTLATLANPIHNSRVPRVHPPSRATTQEMLFQATTQGIPRALPLFWATNPWATTETQVPLGGTWKSGKIPAFHCTSECQKLQNTLQWSFTQLQQQSLLPKVPIL